jgi:hypothetical protein
MPERFFFLVVVLIFLFSSKSSAQGIFVEKNFKSTSIWSFDRIFKRQNGILKFSKNFPDTLVNPKTTDKLNLSTNSGYSLRMPLLQNNLDAQKLSFFCQKEWEFEKATSIPLRFRLGSLEYTNYLEQKPNALKPQ